MRKIALLAVLACVVAPVGAGAQQPSPPPQGTQAAAADQQGVQVQSKSLIGATVRGQDGKDVGTVTNLLIDPAQDRINGVVVSMGGTLGIGAKELTVPWNGLQVGRDRQDLVVTLQQQMLQQAPPRAEDRQDRSEGSASPSSDQKK